MDFSFLTSYFPPAPCLEIQLATPGEAPAYGPVLAFLDTGADGSLVPYAVLDQIGATLIDETRIRSHWGEWRRAEVYTVDIAVADLHFPAVEVVGDDQSDEVILGRNFLNWLHLELDGPKLRVTIHSQ